MTRRARYVLLSGLMVFTGCGHIQSAALPLAARMSGSPDSIALLDMPPAGEMARADLLAIQGPWSAARVAQARADDRFDAFLAFQPVMGGDFTARTYPETRRVLDRLLLPLGVAIVLAKDHYARPRPFVADAGLPTCMKTGSNIRADGSYPSGHAAFGWGWALVLAELAPARADEILLRGREYGDSRIVCGLHYPSDVEAGRTLAAAAVARLHGDDGFRRAVDSARKEIVARQR